MWHRLGNRLCIYSFRDFPNQRWWEQKFKDTNHNLLIKIFIYINQIINADAYLDTQFGHSIPPNFIPLAVKVWLFLHYVTFDNFQEVQNFLLKHWKPRRIINDSSFYKLHKLRGGRVEFGLCKVLDSKRKMCFGSTQKHCYQIKCLFLLRLWRVAMWS